MNRITHALALGAFAIITTEFGIIGILPKIAAHFEVSLHSAGLLVSLFAFVVAASGPFMTLLMERCEKKKVIQAAIVLFVLSTLLSAFAPSFEWLLLARLLPAFLLPVYFSNGLMIAVNSVEKKNAMKAMATVYGGLSVATVIGLPITTYIAELYSWRASFWITAGLNGIALIGISYCIPAIPAPGKRSHGRPLAILKKRVLWLSILTVCFIAAGTFSTYSYFADYLEKIFEMDGSQVSLMLFLFGITGIAGNWAAGIALSKSIYATLMVYLISMIMTFMLLQHTGSNLLLQSVVIGIWGFLHMAGFVISQAWINYFASEAPAFASSLVVSTGNLGIAFGATVGGLIITNLGIQFAPWAGLTLFCLALLLVIRCKAYYQAYSSRPATPLPAGHLSDNTC